jgi:hypothetical protein
MKDIFQCINVHVLSVLGQTRTLFYHQSTPGNLYSVKKSAGDIESQLLAAKTHFLKREPPVHIVGSS